MCLFFFTCGRQMLMFVNKWPILAWLPISTWFLRGFIDLLHWKKVRSTSALLTRQQHHTTLLGGSILLLQVREGEMKCGWLWCTRQITCTNQIRSVSDLFIVGQVFNFHAARLFRFYKFWIHPKEIVMNEQHTATISSPNPQEYPHLPHYYVQFLRKEQKRRPYVSPTSTTLPRRKSPHWWHYLPLVFRGSIRPHSTLSTPACMASDLRYVFRRDCNNHGSRSSWNSTYPNLVLLTFYNSCLRYVVWSLWEKNTCEEIAT